MHFSGKEGRKPLSERPLLLSNARDCDLRSERLSAHQSTAAELGKVSLSAPVWQNPGSNNFVRTAVDGGVKMVENRRFEIPGDEAAENRKLAVRKPPVLR